MSFTVRDSVGGILVHSLLKHLQLSTEKESTTKAETTIQTSEETNKEQIPEGNRVNLKLNTLSKTATAVKRAKNGVFILDPTKCSRRKQTHKQRNTQRNVTF